jgi:hypothetical protein
VAPSARGAAPAASGARDKSHLGNTFMNALPVTGHQEYLRYQR